MRILITGGTGFLGGHTARLLLDQGHRVRLLGRSFAASAGLIAAGAEPFPADLRDPPALGRACAGVDAVVHAGALSAPWGREADFQAINVAGTAALIAACRRHGVRRLVHISSPAVIFDGRDVEEATEAAPYPRRLSSAYARSKRRAEELVRASGLPAVTLRPKAIFGPGDTALLPRVVAAARRGRLPQIGAGRNLVDLTYVENVAHAIGLALTSEAALGRTYHITNDEHVPLWDLIRSLLGRLGLPAALRPVPIPAMLAAAAALEAAAALTRREPLLTRYTVGVLGRTQTYDIAAARRDLGYAPLVSVAAGVERTIGALKT
jgi:nucleoside-diphosphate-sugar epimerase